MCKTRSQHQHSILFVVVELFTFLSFVGCANHVTTTVAIPQTILTKAPPTSSEAPKPTTTLEARITASAPHVSPYIPVMVLDVEIRFLETSPVQVELIIRGTLPDQCKYNFYSVENRVDRNVKVSLAGIHPADMDCLRSVQNIEYMLLLGRDMPEAERGFSSGDYNLTVNNYETSFSIK